MARPLYLLLVFAALSAWAGAQNPAPPLSAEDKLRLLKANGTLIDNLVRDGVALSAADRTEDRAARCRSASLALANAIQQAAAAEDADRVAELTRLFCDLLRDGLAPTISDGLQAIPPQSPSAVKLREVRGLAVGDVSRVQSAIPAGGKLAANDGVKESLTRLATVAEMLK